VKDKQVSLELICEECAGLMTQVEITDKGLLVCRDCADAEARRIRLKQAEIEWNTD